MAILVLEENCLAKVKKCVGKQKKVFVGVVYSVLTS